MLDVERRIDVDPSGEELFHIHIAFGMAAFGCIVMSELIDDGELWPAPQDGVEVHFLEPLPSVIDPPTRDDLKSFKQRCGFSAAMGLNDADDQIDAFAPLGLRRLQHGEGLADARRSAKKQLETAARFLPDLQQQGFG